MKNTAFIIAEYNPFHNGHLYHLQKTKSEGADTLICIMSGHFVQRGEPAFCDKRVRTEAALRSGVDLVLELPLPYVISGAPAFAKGAAFVISACGGEGTLSFGALHPVDRLSALRAAVSDPRVADLVRQLSESSGKTYPAALRIATESVFGREMAVILDDPNSILAVEYMKALSESCENVDYFAVSRSDTVPHDASVPDGLFVSAKFLRDLYYESGQNAFFAQAPSFMPEDAFNAIEKAIRNGAAPYRKDIFSAIAVSRLMQTDAQAFRKINGVNQGIENRILAALSDASDLFSLYDAVKSKRFTHARIRQILLSAVLGVEREMLTVDPPYVRVLGFNKKGRARLRSLRDNSAVPFIMNISEAPHSGFRELDCRAGKLYELMKPSPRNVNAEFVSKPVVIDC